MSTGLFPCTQYLGMSMALLLPSARQSFAAMDLKQFGMLVAIALSDLCGTTLTYMGLVLAGSGLYVVLYSSIVLWTALFRVAFLKRSIRGEQCLALFGIVGGIAASALNSAGAGEDVSLGILTTLLGAVVYGATYVMSESLLYKPGAPAPSSVCAFVGLMNLALVSAYILWSALPRMDELLLAPVRAAGADLRLIAMLFGVAWLSLGAHFLALYRICSTSAVAAGVNRSAQTVGVFAISALLFCDRQAAQCYTSVKGISTAVVVGGILLYNLGESTSASASRAKGGAAPAKCCAPLLKT